MYLVEFTQHAKPGHFDQVAEISSAFAANFLSNHPALQSVMIVADEAAGLVRALALYTDRESAEAVNSDPEFAEFNDQIRPLLASTPERIELKLLHHYVR